MTEQKYAAAGSGASFVEDSATPSSTNSGASAPIPKWLESAYGRTMLTDLAHPQEAENYRRSLQTWFLGYLRYHNDSISEFSEAEVYRYEVLSDFFNEITRYHLENLIEAKSAPQGHTPEVSDLLEQHNQLAKDRAKQFYEDRLAEKDKFISQLQESNDQLFKLLNEWKSKLAEKEATTTEQEGGQAA